MTPEERREYNRRYWLENKDAIVAKRALRKGAAAPKRKAWRDANKEALASRQRQRYLATIDSQRARRREWARINRPDHVRRARKAATRVGKVDYSEILSRWDGKCHICRKAIVEGDKMHFDHVVPLAKGGAHVTENIWPAHAVCNLRKQDKLVA